MPEQESFIFPSDFLFGAATSSYQVEGNNSHCDWWEWEKRVGLPDTSGEACRHYQLFQEDFDLAQSLHHNCHRLSFEWSRIEPQEGFWDEQAIAHYREVIAALRKRGLEPIVTLHHFTNPLWFARIGGWEHLSSVEYYLRYVKKVVEVFAHDVRYWVTINEPLVYTYHAYLIGAWPPQKRSFSKTKVVTDYLLQAHIKAYTLIHQIYKNEGMLAPLVSIAHNMQDFVPCSRSFKNVLFSRIRSQLYNFDIIENLNARKSLDFIGINYYTRALVDIRGWGMRDFLVKPCSLEHSTLEKNTMGWDVYPEGLYHLLSKMKKYKLPILILENGICIDNDVRRWNFIREHLLAISRALREGIRVKAYVYWSLLDNFEWDKGFKPRFGLIDVDYKTFARTVRESARQFAVVCQRKRL
ncbi:MAG: glycoside hydrolase family 1 protein [Candidatus Omnitrophica bacterium]|nr:glycoside hydrolase family 1 protein [Candidatus Omnitrophota bacterium]